MIAQEDEIEPFVQIEGLKLGAAHRHRKLDQLQWFEACHDIFLKLYLFGGRFRAYVLHIAPMSSFIWSSWLRHLNSFVLMCIDTIIGIFGYLLLFSGRKYFTLEPNYVASIYGFHLLSMNKVVTSQGDPFVYVLALSYATASVEVLTSMYSSISPSTRLYFDSLDFLTFLFSFRSILV